jgi:hypothetical protein
MVTIPNFDKFLGLKFVDSTALGAKLECVGYGDSTNSPYFVGVAMIQDKLVVRTVLFKNASFYPLIATPPQKP